MGSRLDNTLSRRSLLHVAIATMGAACAPSAPTAVLDRNRRYTESLVLPAPRSTSSMSIEELLERRRSRREYRSDEPSLAVVGQLLWAGQGITDRAGHRTAPSAGARYPIELYAVSPTTFMHYLPARHELESRSDETTLRELSDLAFGQQFVSTAPIVFVITGVVARTEAEYGAVSELLMNREAGHVAQNMLLQATALDLAAVPVGGFDPAAVARALALAPGEEPLYLMPVGHPFS